MKSIIIISVITFVLIFGGVMVVSQQLNKVAMGGVLPDLAPEDYVAAERVFQDMAVERDRIQQEKEQLLALKQSVAVQEKVLEQGREQLEAVIAKLGSKQDEYLEERERSERDIKNEKRDELYKALTQAFTASLHCCSLIWFCRPAT